MFFFFFRFFLKGCLNSLLLKCTGPSSAAILSNLISLPHKFLLPDSHFNDINLDKIAAEHGPVHFNLCVRGVGRAELEPGGVGERELFGSVRIVWIFDHFFGFVIFEKKKEDKSKKS